MCKDKKSKPMSGEVKVPSIFECRFDQFIEVHDLKAPGVIIVNDLVHCVEGVEVRGDEVACGGITKDFKAIIDC